MPSNKILLFSIFFIILGIYFSTQTINNGTFPPSTTINQVENIKTMRITSPVFKNNEKIPAKYTCDGENINPPLEISDIPENTVSLALIVDDPDAPRGLWSHWLVWNIDPATKEIAENSMPAGAMQGKTDSGRMSYSGPCPSRGTHHYFFSIYALNTKLNLLQDTNEAGLKKAIEDHILASGELIGLYNR